MTLRTHLDSCQQKDSNSRTPEASDTAGGNVEWCSRAKKHLLVPQKAEHSDHGGGQPSYYQVRARRCADERPCENLDTNVHSSVTRATYEVQTARCL